MSRRIRLTAFGLALVVVVSALGVIIVGRAAEAQRERVRQEQIRASVMHNLGGQAGIDQLMSAASITARRIALHHGVRTAGEAVELTAAQRALLLSVLAEPRTYSVYLPDDPLPSCLGMGYVEYEFSTPIGARSCTVEFGCFGIRFQDSGPMIYRQSVREALFLLARDLFPGDVELADIAESTGD